MLILQPTAEHVREAQSRIQCVSTDLGQANARMDQLQAAISKVHENMLTLQSALRTTNGQLEKAKGDLSNVQVANLNMEAELQAVRGSLGKTDARLQASTSSLESLLDKFEDLSSTVQRLQNGAMKSGKTLTEHGESLTELHDFYKGLSYRQLDMTKELENCAQVSTGCDRGLKRVLGSLAQQKEEDSKNSGRLGERLNLSDQMLADANRNLSSLSDKLANHETTMAKALEAHEAERAHQLEATNKRLAGVDGLLEECGDRLKEAERSLTSLRKDFGAESRSVSDLLHDLSGKVSSQAADLRIAEEILGAHGDQIKKTDRCMGDVLKEQQKLRISTDTLERDALSTNAWKVDATNRLETHTRLLQKRADADATRKEFDDVAKAVLGLREHLSTSDALLAKLTSRFDACNKNLHGLSKGFEDVHRHVVLGENGMLPPRSNTGAGLPHLRPATAGPGRHQHS